MYSYNAVTNATSGFALGAAGGELAEAPAELDRDDEAPVRDVSTRVLRVLKDHVGNACALIGVGGVMEPQDAVAKLAAGADLVQLYTGLIYRGPRLVGECVEAMRAFGGSRN